MAGRAACSLRPLTDYDGAALAWAGGSRKGSTYTSLRVMISARKGHYIKSYANSIIPRYTSVNPFERRVWSLAVGFLQRSNPAQLCLTNTCNPLQPPPLPLPTVPFHLLFKQHIIITPFNLCTGGLQSDAPLSSPTAVGCGRLPCNPAQLSCRSGQVKSTDHSSRRPAVSNRRPASSYS
ncbi:hypothetical protein J6590_011445 [Homalodisca vitripennis]|nr:hypothetical protein J6590_011445 [Homalodisca vitripennis]